MKGFDQGYITEIVEITYTEIMHEMEMVLI